MVKCIFKQHRLMSLCLLGVALLGMTAYSSGSVVSSSKAIQLAKAGKSTCTIIITPGEEDAAAELKTHLDKITGADFEVVPEAAYTNQGPAIYLGKTEFATKHGIDFSTFAPEEWLIKTVDGSLIITGSRINGTLFGVYDLLENQLGCHWFAFDSTYIPNNPDISLGNLDIRKQPSFADRMILSHPPRGSHAGPTLVTPETETAFRLFVKRSRDHRNNQSPLAISKQYYFCHNFYSFVSPEKYFKTHPEYFSMNEKGERFYGRLGELCMNEKGE